MMIDWSAFTPYSSLLGGAMIGLAAAILVLFNGRIAGISGITGMLLGKVLRHERSDTIWRVTFLLGLLSAPWLWSLFQAYPFILTDTSTSLLIMAGLLVGIGTRLGSGCTSGHGVCGLARLSPRSLAATATFMTAGFVTVYLLRHGG